MGETRPEEISRACVLTLMMLTIALTTVLSACLTHEAQGTASGEGTPLEQRKVPDDIMPAPSPAASPKATKSGPKATAYKDEYVDTQILSPKRWVFADYNSIWRTVDGGRTFERSYVSQFPELPHRFGGLSFSDPMHGFVIEQGPGWYLGASSSRTSSISSTTGKLIRTTDGGSSWNIVGPISSGNERSFFWHCYFVNPLHGWAVGANNSVPSKGIILSTRDGGKSWVRQTLPRQPADLRWSLHGVLFLDDNIGWTCGPMFMFWTVNGGRTWNQAHAENWDYTDLGFYRPGVVWASEWEGTGFAISRDCGRRFKVFDGPRSSFYGHASIVFFGARGIIANDNLYVTSDGGQNWSVKDLGPDAHDVFWFKAARAMDGSLVAIGSRESVVVAFNSRDGGSTWTKIH